ncbi:hypothetical protein GCM10011335_42340 [Aureimonas glaciei]|uniref:Uncharacterized protein n=1 Tax=Aureimonas glaciei TaxID=1776957 RepID=A0A916Y9M1_9HYPH|nr:hypothetical protein GCM10011335_42340 [Aureimonas glaciei]
MRIFVPKLCANVANIRIVVSRLRSTVVMLCHGVAKLRRPDSAANAVVAGAGGHVEKLEIVAVSEGFKMAPRLRPGDRPAILVVYIAFAAEGGWSLSAEGAGGPWAPLR